MVADYSRTKNALIGCVGVTAVAFAGLYVTVQQSARKTRPGRPCLASPERIRPVLVGDTLRLAIRTLGRGSDCSGNAPADVAWQTADASIVEVTPDGLVRGLSPGMFSAVARGERDTLRATGFVLPPEWQTRIAPDSAMLRVGDSLRMVVRAFDKAGTALPKVPFSVFTPEFFDPVTRKRPIINELSWQDVVEPVLIMARDTGTTMLVGRIGFQQVSARLIVRPR
jgi:hypothetical protein